MLRHTSIRSLLMALPTAVLAVSLSAQTTAPAPAAAPEKKEEVLALQPFSVTAEKSTGYKVSSSTTATRTNTALIDIPQTVDIVTSEFWNDRNATTFDDSFKYVSNVYVRNRNAGGGDTVNLRGFQTSGSVMVDGIRLLTNYKHNLTGYDRLEVIKGPASAVQGRAGGSGMLNYILKKPVPGNNWTALKYTFGADDFDGLYNRGEFDTNFRINQSGSLLGRVAGAMQKSDDYIEFQETSLFTIYPSFSWKISDKTDLVMTNEYLDESTPSREEGHGFQLYPVKLRKLIPMFDTPSDPITVLNLPYNFNAIGPDNYQDTRVMSSTLFLTHQFNDELSFRQALHWHDVEDETVNYTAASNVATNIASTWTKTNDTGESFTIQGDLIKEFHTKYFSGHALIGYNYSEVSTTSKRNQGTPSAPFNRINLVTLAGLDDRLSYFDGREAPNPPLNRDTTGEATNFSGYVNLGLEFFKDRLLLTGGLRRENDSSEGKNLLNGTATGGSDTWLNSWQYGATYKIRPKLALYAVESLQYDPASTRSVYGGLPPEDPRNNEFFTVQPFTKLKEIGLKTELLNGRVTTSASYWEMNKEGGVQTLSHLSDDTASDYSKTVQVKGALSEGFEISAYGSVTERFSVIANYMKMKTSQQDTLSNDLDSRVPGLFAPSWGLNLWGKYTFRNAQGQGWLLKGGISFIGPSWTTLTNFTGSYEIPHVQKNIDLGVGYRWRRYDFDLMVNNVDNDPFLITRDQASRNYRLSVSAQF